MSDKDFEAIYAIKIEAPERIGVMIASTPTGRRGKFYKACKDPELAFNFDDVLKPRKSNYGMVYDYRKYDRKKANGWKEFHYPTMVNPEWSPNMEKELRAQFTEDAYEHEVLAEFGTETIGVFNKDYIDEASSTGYGLLSRPVHDGPISIGIDWDKNNVHFESNLVDKKQVNCGEVLRAFTTNYSQE